MEISEYNPEQTDIFFIFMYIILLLSPLTGM